MKLRRVMALTVILSLFLAAGAFAANIVVEGESYYKIEPSMKLAKHKEASGQKYVGISLHRPHGENEGEPLDKGHAAYKIEVPRTDNYRLWGRCWWYDACGNSFFILVDTKDITKKTPYITDQVFQKWHWVPGPLLHLTKGQHIIRFQNREDGSCLDQWLLTTRPKRRWVPVRVQQETDQYIVERAKDKDKDD